MITTIQSICVRVCLVLACCSMAAGQTTTSNIANGKAPVYSANPANVPDALQKVESGNFYPVHVNMLAHFNATEAIPALEKQFPLSKDPLTKAAIARALVKLHDGDITYWQYLVNLAIPAVANDAPDYYIYDSQGKVAGGPSPELVAWAKKNNISIEEASSDAVYGRGFRGIQFIAMTGDPRGVPLLRRALSARNKVVEAYAAQGLAEVQDKASIPLIIAACEKAPKEPASLIAQALVYFDDPTAQAAASKYLSATVIKGLNDNRAKGHKTPFDW